MIVKPKPHAAALHDDGKFLTTGATETDRFTQSETGLGGHRNPPEAFVPGIGADGCGPAVARTRSYALLLNGNDIFVASRPGVFEVQNSQISRGVDGRVGNWNFCVDGRLSPKDLLRVLASFQPGEGSAVWGIVEIDGSHEWSDGQVSAVFGGERRSPREAAESSMPSWDNPGSAADVPQSLGSNLLFNRPLSFQMISGAGEVNFSLAETYVPWIGQSGRKATYSVVLLLLGTQLGGQTANAGSRIGTPLFDVEAVSAEVESLTGKTIAVAGDIQFPDAGFVRIRSHAGGLEFVEVDLEHMPPEDRQRLAIGCANSLCYEIVVGRMSNGRLESMASYPVEDANSP